MVVHQNRTRVLQQHTRGSSKEAMCYGLRAFRIAASRLLPAKMLAINPGVSYTAGSNGSSQACIEQLQCLLHQLVTLSHVLCCKHAAQPQVATCPCKYSRTSATSYAAATQMRFMHCIQNKLSTHLLSAVRVLMLAPQMHQHTVRMKLLLLGLLVPSCCCCVVVKNMRKTHQSRVSR